MKKTRTIQPIDGIFIFCFLLTMLTSWLMFAAKDEQVRTERAQYLESRLCGCPEAP